MVKKVGQPRHSSFRKLKSIPLSKNKNTVLKKPIAQNKTWAIDG